MFVREKAVELSYLSELLFNCQEHDILLLEELGSVCQVREHNSSHVKGGNEAIGGKE